MENAKTLKAISGKGAPAKGSACGNMMAQLKKVPGVDQIQKSLKGTKPKQYVDLAIFTLGIYLMYRFGKAFAEKIEDQLPTEKSMMEMMK